MFCFMILLIIGIVLSVFLLFYFIWCNIKESVFPRLYFDDNEKVDLSDVKFVKIFLKIE